jgi:hypothetical protein
LRARVISRPFLLWKDGQTMGEVIKKNLDLHSEWMKYTFENSDVLDRIPKGTVLVILPEDNKELYAENYKERSVYVSMSLDRSLRLWNRHQPYLVFPFKTCILQRTDFFHIAQLVIYQNVRTVSFFDK